MKNIKTSIQGDIMTIEVDMSKDFGPSKSGKTIIIASTEGNITPDDAPDSVKMGLNIYKGR